VPFSRVTPRERQVAREMCRRGSTGQFPTMVDVAKRLGCTVGTAKAHLRTLAIKLPNPHGLPAQRLVRSLESVFGLVEGRSPTPPKGSAAVA
jgi:hypothetical protein